MSRSPRNVRNVAIAHFATTWFMVGLMWTIHFIHYALFPKVGTDSFVEFERAHVDRIGNLLLLPWLSEGLTLLALLWLAFFGGRRHLRGPMIINGIAMAIVLVISGFWSAPAHGKLMKGFDLDVYNRLMHADLVRTFAWTACGVAAAWALHLLWSNEDSTERTPR